MAGAVTPGARSGAFSPNGAAGSRLNPYRDPGPWARLTIGGILLPGIIVSIDGANKPETWLVQQGISVSHAVSVWRGTKLAEEIKIVLNLYDEEAYDNYEIIAKTLRPKIGTKPPSLPIVHPTINFAKITRCSCKDVLPPKPAPGSSWTGEIQLIEFNQPKPAKIGPADPPKAKTENDLLADELAKVIEVAKKS